MLDADEDDDGVHLCAALVACILFCLKTHLAEVFIYIKLKYFLNIVLFKVVVLEFSLVCCCLCKGYTGRSKRAHPSVSSLMS